MTLSKTQYRELLKLEIKLMKKGLSKKEATRQQFLRYKIATQKQRNSVDDDVENEVPYPEDKQREKYDEKDWDF